MTHWTEWLDYDVALHKIARQLDLVSEPFAPNKWIYWSRNPLGDFLGELLDFLVKSGVVEQNEETDQYRWNPAFNTEELTKPFRLKPTNDIKNADCISSASKETELPRTVHTRVCD